MGNGAKGDTSKGLLTLMGLEQVTCKLYDDEEDDHNHDRITYEGINKNNKFRKY
jgi:hypothetical protein